MLYFLYGADTYRLQKKAQEIENQYLKVNQGVLNLEKFDAKDIAFDDFWQALSQRAMFIQKKLFFVENVFAVERFMAAFAKKVKDIAQSADVVVILEKKEPSKTNPLFKALLKQGQVQEFAKIDGPALKDWLKRELAQYGAVIEENAVNDLMLFVGNDLWRLSNELKKLASYSKNIREQDVKLLIKPKIETEIFRTIDALAERNKGLALRLLRGHLEKGDSPFYVFSMFVYQFRNLLAVKSAEGQLGRLSRLKLHPFVLKKASQQASRFPLAELEKIYQKIFETDYKIKTGRIDPEQGIKMLVAEM